MKYHILDWAGNIKFHGERFNSFENAWTRIYEHFSDLTDDAFEEACGEFYVCEENVGDRCS